MTDFIKVKNLTYEYNKTEQPDESIRQFAVSDISFNVKKGSFVAVIGQNGSGKSTLAKNLNGLLIPTEGSIEVDGFDTADANNTWEVRSRVAMVFQNPDNQIVSAIVEDDVAFGPENQGVEPAEIRRRVDSALEAVGMSEYARKAPHLLSGGQKQRIAIAGAIAMESECIVFDEPTAMLDPQGRAGILKIIEDLHQKGKTVILITHFMEEAAQADEIIVMNNGVIKMTGTPLEVFERTDEILELGLDVPAPVQLANELRKRGIDVAKDVLTTEDLIGSLIAK